MAGDILQALKDSYQEAIEARQKVTISQKFNVASVRRYMLYAVDLLNLYLRIKRDREWQKYDDRDDWW